MIRGGTIQMELRNNHHHRRHLHLHQQDPQQQQEQQQAGQQAGQQTGQQTGQQGATTKQSLSSLAEVASGDALMTTTTTMENTSGNTTRLLGAPPVLGTGAFVEPDSNDVASHDPSPSQQVDMPSIIFLLGLFLFLFLFTCLKYWICEGPITRRQRRRARDDRRRLIRDRVVFKTVVKKEGTHGHNKASSEDKEESDTNSVITRQEEDLDALESKTSDEEEGGRTSSSSQPQSFIHKYCRQKTNLEISTSRHNPAGGVDGGGDCSSRLECQICLADFEVGDKICWSNNPDCVHTFHVACLEPWLMKHDECPLCRSPYLVPPKESPLTERRETGGGRGNDGRGASPITRHVVAVLSLLFFFRRSVQTDPTGNIAHHEEEEAPDHQNNNIIPEITVGGNRSGSAMNDNDPSSPTMIPLEEEEVSDCSSNEERIPPADIESGVPGRQ